MRTKFKPWTLPYLKENNQVATDIIDLNHPIFTSNKPLFLEVGGGKGGFIINLASKYPDYNFIMIEKVVTIAGIATKRIVESELKNIIVVYCDIENFFTTLNKPLFDGIFLNFSDPWPKKRHEKRRLTHERFLSFYYECLKETCRLIVKTDQVPLYDFTLERIEKTKFKLISNTNNYKTLEEFDSLTEYETNFRESGISINRIVLEK